MQGDTTTPPFGAEAFDPVTQHLIRVQYEKAAAAELARAHRHRAGRQLAEPEIDLGIMASGAARVVMIDHGGAALCQAQCLGKRNLFGKGFGAFAVVPVIDEAVVGIGKDQIALSQLFEGTD